MEVYISGGLKKSRILIYSREENDIQGIIKKLDKTDFIIEKVNKEEDLNKIGEQDLIILFIYKLSPLEIIPYEKLKHIPVLAVLNKKEKNFSISKIENSIDDILFSPVNKEELLFRIRTLLNLKMSQKKILEEQEDKLKLLNFRDNIMKIMIHDIGNSISGVVGSLDLLKLQSKNLDEKQNKNVVRIDESAKELLNIIKNVGDIVHVTEKDYFSLEEVNISKLIKDLKENKESFFVYNKRNLIIESFTDNIIVKGSGETIIRIFENLISNGIKNTPRNGNVIIKIEKDGDFAKITVKDEGKPLPVEYRKKIFTLYGQLEIFDAGFRIGRGFSIVSCSSAINSMGGKIWMEDPGEEKANIISFTMPLCEKSEE